MTRIKMLWVIAFVLWLPACSSIPVTHVTVQSYELQKKGIEAKAGMNHVLNALVDRGFDVKLSNAESGIVTTEYKKFASAGDDPPFDYYLQIRSTVRTNRNLTSRVARARSDLVHERRLGCGARVGPVYGRHHSECHKVAGQRSRLRVKAIS